MKDFPPGLADALPGHYRIERELGRGGMATVYLAHDARHGRDLALKVLRPELAALLGRDRFLAEIRLTARLDHPHILTLIDSGESGGHLWYALPYVRGESLRTRLQRVGALPLDEALTIATDIAGALDYAHAHGVVHRDVKPENILLHEGEAMLMDFGIALAVSESGGERLTETGLSIGTPQYMSPEQATAARQLDGRSDVFSLGAVVYEMLAGEPPFSGPNSQAIIAKLMTERPTRIRTVRDTVPEAVDQTVTRALAKVPADRFPDASSFASALRHAAVAPAGPTRRRAPLVLLGLLVVVLLAWIGWRSGLARPTTAAVHDRELAAIYQRARHEYDRRTVAGAEAAVRGFSEIVRRDSSYAAAWTGLAQTYVRAYIRAFPLPGLPRDTLLPLAVIAVERSLALDSLDPNTWVAQAEISRSIDPTSRTAVLRAITRALAIDSTSAEAWHLFALARAETGDLPAAINGWRRAVTVSPNYVQALAFLSWGYYWHHQLDSAAIWADSAVATDPNYYLGRSTVGWVVLEQGQYDRAIAAFAAAGRLSGDIGDIEVVNSSLGQAIAEARAGRRGEALALLAQAEQQAQGYTSTALHTDVWLAGAELALGNQAKAVEWLSRFRPRADLHFQLHIRCDPLLGPLAHNRAYQALLTPLPQKVGSGC